jgi:type I restriction enzyme S subunit
VIGGGTPRTDDQANFEHGDIPWITPADLSGYREKHISKGARNITKRGLANSGARLMPEGTVLFSSRAPIGYVAIASNAVTTNQGFKSFVFPGGIKPDYAYYYLQRAKDLAVELSSGTTFREISGAKAALIPFPVPPTPEQGRIVSEIEKQFTRLDAAVAALKRVQANLKRYRAAVLKAACEGRLVPAEAELARRENRSYEPAAVLLERILAERRVNVGADQSKYKPPKSQDFSDKPQLSEGWIWTSFEQLLVYLRNGISQKPDAESGQPILRISAVRPMKVDLEDVRYLRGNAESYSEYIVEDGDLLFTRYNGNPTLTGVCGVVRSPTIKIVHPDKLIRARVPKHFVDSRFVEIVLNTGESRRFLESRTRTTAGQSGISGSDLRSVPVPLAPYREQQRITIEADRLLSNIDALQTEVESDLKRAERLRQAILKRAFEGKLVAQDPTEEPAGSLLERIRAEREVVSSISRKGAKEIVSR